MTAPEIAARLASLSGPELLAYADGLPRDEATDHLLCVAVAQEIERRHASGDLPLWSDQERKTA